MSIGRARVLIKSLNFRSGPGTDRPTYGTLFLGDELDVLEDLGAWLHVSLSGREGYVSSDPRYVAFERKHTTEADLIAVTLPYPTKRPVLFHPRAAEAYSRALAYPGLSQDEVKLLCSVASSFRAWDVQMDMIHVYEAAIGEPWKSWNDLSQAQKDAAHASKYAFAFHPGNPPVDAPHTHVGGGALDLPKNLPPKVVEALNANGFRMDSGKDPVHWGWHG